MHCISATLIAETQALPYIAIFGNMVDFDLIDPKPQHNRMTRNKNRKCRNINGLHKEVITPLHGGLTKLPTPTTPFSDMKVLSGRRNPASLFEHVVDRPPINSFAAGMPFIYVMQLQGRARKNPWTPWRACQFSGITPHLEYDLDNHPCAL